MMALRFTQQCPGVAARLVRNLASASALRTSPGEFHTSPEHATAFARDGFVKIDNVFNVNQVSEWVDEISRWPKVERKWLVHWEKSEAAPEGKLFCRAENFVNYHDGMKELADLVGRILSDVVDREMILFKEKINYKLPGGNGFSAHQDSPAYLGFCDWHVSACVMVDACTPENGALQCVAGPWTKDSNVPLTESGVVTPEAEAKMEFQTITGNPGDLILFDGWTPHRSDPNHSNKSRRAIFLTYNAAVDGDFHAAYYEMKHNKAAGFDAAKTISFQGDFQGEIVE